MMRVALTILLLSALPVQANIPQVVGAKAVHDNATWSFAVTVRHADSGWDHYADGWGVYAPDGTRLGYRILLHPHVGEQPFTRSLSGVAIPADIGQVVIRAHDLVHGDGPDFPLALPRQ